MQLGLIGGFCATARYAENRESAIWVEVTLHYFAVSGFPLHFIQRERKWQTSGPSEMTTLSPFGPNLVLASTRI